MLVRDGVVPGAATRGSCGAFEPVKGQGEPGEGDPVMIRLTRWGVLQAVGTAIIATPLMLSGTFSVAAQSTDTANGGTAAADGGSGSVVFGDVMTGQNVGNVINTGDIVNSDAELKAKERLG